jgi:hypothetical protein
MKLNNTESIPSIALGACSIKKADKGKIGGSFDKGCGLAG